jgi:transcriptional regulator with XRE-family HTH domain
MSRATLGEFIGLTHQQVEKYERGANRIGASRIQQISEVLKIPPSYVFEGSPGLRSHDNGASQLIDDLMCSPEGPRLAAAFGRVADPNVRRDIVRMVTGIAGSQPKAPADAVRLDDAGR